MKAIKLEQGGSAHIHEDGNGVNVVLGFVLPHRPTDQHLLTYRDVRELIVGLQSIIADRDARTVVRPGESDLSEAEIERLADEAERGCPPEQIKERKR